MNLTVNVHTEDGAFWADVPELPGCFASGATLDELLQSLGEGIKLHLAGDESSKGSLAAEAQRLMEDPAHVSEARELAALFEDLRKIDA